MDVSDLGNIDGINMWSALSSGKQSPRSEVLINVDDIENYAAIRRGDFKYVIGITSTGKSWLGENGRPELENGDGTLPIQDPEMILKSRTGVALTGVITARQVKDLKNIRDNKLIGVEIGGKILKDSIIQTMRIEATLNCNIAEADKVR